MSVTAPAEVIVPAKVPAVPPAIEVMSEKLGAAPVVTADPAIASAWVNDWLKLKLLAGTSWVTVRSGGVPTPLLITSAPIPLATALSPEPCVVSTPVPLIE